MNYRKLDIKTSELHRKYKDIQNFCKDKIIQGEKSYRLNEYEKEVYKKFLFYNNLKKAIKK